MRVICSYCRKVIRDVPGERCGVSHGMCGECDRYFEKLWGGMSLSEYLDDLPVPVLVVDADGRVAAASGALARMLGRSPSELRGLLGGEAMACAYSRLPEGCGKTVHCRECTIRRAVARVSQTRRGEQHVPVWLRTDDGRKDFHVTVQPEGAFVRVTLEA